MCAHLSAILRVLAWIALGMILLLGLRCRQEKRRQFPDTPTWEHRAFGPHEHWVRDPYRVASLIPLCLGIASDRLAWARVMSTG